MIERLLMKTLPIPVLLLSLSLPALAKDKDDKDKGIKGAPGPVIGAGLPLLLIGGGIYWLARRRKKAT
jgi:LPXTG-motif cell wall-anchored protein